MVRRRTVLDLGAYDGNFSSGQVRAGDRWILVDNEQWRKYGWGEPVRPDNAEYVVMDIMDYHEPAEIVVCSNVLYHVPDPHKLLKHLRKLTLETLYLRTYFDEGEQGWNYYGKDNPAHPNKSTAETIYSRPTVNTLVDELKRVGFKNIAVTKKGGLVTVECSYE